MFLDKAQLKTLTGFSHRECQIRVLRERAIPFYINGKGEPVVAVAVIEGNKSAAPKPESRWQPAALK